MKKLIILMVVLSLIACNPTLRIPRHKLDQSERHYGTIYQIDYILKSEKCSDKKAMRIYTDSSIFYVCGHWKCINISNEVWLREILPGANYVVINGYKYPLK